MLPFLTGCLVSVLETIVIDIFINWFVSLGRGVQRIINRVLVSKIDLPSFFLGLLGFAIVCFSLWWAFLLSIKYILPLF